MPAAAGEPQGVVEKANHVAAQRFWRTLPDDVSLEEAQARLDTWCAMCGDTRLRPTAAGRSSVATIAAAEPLREVGPPFPALLSVTRTVSAQALVSFRGNRYSVPPQLHGTAVTVTVRLGAGHLDVTTTPSPSAPRVMPTVIARHRLAPTGAGATIRDDVHVAALNAAALAASTPAPPHRGKVRLPPSPTARGHAAALTAASDDTTVVDLARYAAAANGRNTLTPSRPAIPTGSEKS